MPARAQAAHAGPIRTRRRSDVTAYGFDLIDGTLRFQGDGTSDNSGARARLGLRRYVGPAGPPATPMLGFEPRGLVISTADGLDVWPWERHVGRDAGPLRWYAACDGRRLTLRAPQELVVVDTTAGAAVVELVEAVSRTPGIQERLEDREWLDGVMAALAAEGPKQGPAGPRILGDG